MDHFRSQKSRFLDFFKFVCELFRQCLGIDFRLEMPAFSPLGSREALKNVDKASPGLFIPLTLRFFLKFSPKKKTEVIVTALKRRWQTVRFFLFRGGGHS